MKIKIVFVDFVASGGVSLVSKCRQSFSQEIISAYFNQRFIACKLMLKRRKSLPKKYDVTRVPSMLFFSPEGKRLSNKIVGPISLTDLVTNSDVCCWRSFCH